MLRQFMFALSITIFLSGCGATVDVVDTDEYSFQVINYPGADFTEMLSVNNVGQALGRYKINNYADYVNDPWILFTYDIESKEFTPFPIEDLSALSNTVRGIDFNDNGQFTITNSGGVFYDTNTKHLFKTDPWVTPSDIRFISINNEKRIVGWHFNHLPSEDQFKIGFLYDLENETLIYANYPEARNTQFFGINDAGLIIARYTLENGTSDLTIYDSINENFIDLNISADTSEWDITDINNNGIVIANTEGVCPDNSSVLDPCGNTIHKYNINTGEHRQDSVLYLMTGLSNEALQLAGKVNHRVSPFTGKGESTGLLATPK